MEAREFIEKEHMNESKKPKKVVRNDEGKVVPEHCDCGGKVAVFIEGEPIYKCTACGKYYGTMPFPKKGLNESLNKENKNMKKNVIKLNESQLCNIIVKTIKEAFNELPEGMWYFKQNCGLHEYKPLTPECTFEKYMEVINKYFECPYPQDQLEMDKYYQMYINAVKDYSEYAEPEQTFADFVANDY